MHTSIQLGLLALISAAAAVPHNSHDHSRFHNGGYRKTQSTGWGGYSNSSMPVGTGTGASSVPSSSDIESTSTSTSTSTIYSTTYQTVYITTKPQASGSAAATASAVEISSGAGECGPATVTVTATNRVTVTVGAAGADVPAASSSSSEAVAPSSDQSPSPASTTALPVYSAPLVSSSPSSASEAKVTSESTVTLSSLINKGKTSSVEAATTSASIESSTAASSSAPAASSKAVGGAGPAYYGTKRGLAYNDIDLLSKFKSGNFGWTFNWAQSPGDWNKLNGAQFIPMMHNPIPGSPDHPNVESWLKNVDAAVKQGTHAVFGFNEVDQDGQAKMSVSDACQYWKEYMEPILSAHPEVTIIGPSVTNGPPPMGLAWLDAFQKECPSATYHVTNIHFYDIYNEKGDWIEKGTVDRFKDHVKNTISRYGKPVFVSEFGLVPGSGNEEQATKFLKECMEFLDGEDQVKGYAYFMAKDVPLGLISGQSLSSTGEAYVH